MKWLFLIFLAINLVYFGWELDRQTSLDLQHKYQALSIPAGIPVMQLVRELDNPPLARNQQPPSPVNDTTGNDPEPQEQDINPEFQQADVMIEEKFATELVSQLPDISIKTISLETAPTTSMCFTFGPFPDYKQSGQLINWFESRQVKHEQRLESEAEKQLFWIYLEPHDSRDSAIEAMADLKSKGINDLRLIEVGNMQNAISLGLFSTQASVNKRLNEIKNKGYQAVVIPYRDSDAIYWIDISLTGQTNMLNEIFTGFPSRFNSVPVNCSEIALR